VTQINGSDGRSENFMYKKQLGFGPQAVVINPYINVLNNKIIRSNNYNNF
jgi:hypothetical protein